jgi:putative redox protein
MTMVIVRGGAASTGLVQQIESGRHTLTCDEPVEAGGTDAGPGPYDLLVAALGACTSMTLQIYARRKGWPLEAVTVRLRHHRVHARDCADCETKEGRIDHIERDIEVVGPLDAEQRQKLLEIANKCPVHRTLASEIKVRTSLI